MKREDRSLTGPWRDSQRGQVLVLAVLLLVVLLGASALAVDLGFAYLSHQELVAATDAAALAGASGIPEGNAIAMAQQYGATSNNFNSRFNLHSVTISSHLVCLKSTALGIPPCAVYGSQPSANAIVVTERAEVPTFFAKIFGIQTVKIAATSTAAKGGSYTPVHVVVLLDATYSMNDTDNDSQCNNTRLYCAEAGVRSLLSNMSPCPLTNASCVAGSDATGNASVTNAVDQVALMAFPGLVPSDTSTLSDPPVAAPNANLDYDCSSSSPKTTSYNNNPGYLILPLGSNYRTSNSSTTLNTNSSIVSAMGGKSSCTGMSAPGGQGTFYAGAIASAQSYLLANAEPNVPNAIVFLSDGNAGNGKMGGSATSYPNSNQCQQAVTAANTAKAAGVNIYSIAYGAQSSGCPGETITPCQTMERISGASSNFNYPSTGSPYFFSDYTASGGTSSCVSASYPSNNLKDIFSQIGVQLSTARLLPNNTP